MRSELDWREFMINGNSDDVAKLVEQRGVDQTVIKAEP